MNGDFFKHPFDRKRQASFFSLKTRVHISLISGQHDERKVKLDKCNTINVWKWFTHFPWNYYKSSPWRLVDW
jgi:hypothetical protein